MTAIVRLQPVRASDCFGSCAPNAGYGRGTEQLGHIAATRHRAALQSQHPAILVLSKPSRTLGSDRRAADIRT
jgi:hypothetical protein